MTKSKVGSSTLIPVLFVLTLFLLLSALSVSVILAGSSVYEKISANMDQNYDRRVTFSYLTTKIRQNDSAGEIYVKTIDGVEMIAIHETGEEYITYIYYHDGHIREIYLELEGDGQTVEFELDWGEEIIQAEGFEFNFSEDRGQIEMKLTDSKGYVQSTKIYLRSRGG